MRLLLLALPWLSWDFSEGPGGFVPSGDAQQWEWGVPTAAPGGSDALWGTILDGLYLNDAEDVLQLPPLDLQDLARPVLRAHHWYQVAPGDRATIEVNDGNGWITAEPIYGYPDPAGFVGASGWGVTWVDLSDLGGSPQVRFKLQTDASFAEAGWYLSRVEIFDGDITPPRFMAVTEPQDTQNIAGPYVIEAHLIDDVQVQGVNLRWSTQGLDEVVPMEPAGSDVWTAEIPGLPPDTEVEWSLEALDTSGNSARWPEAGDRHFRVFLAAPTGLRRVEQGRPVGPNVLLTWDPPDSPHEVLGYHLVDVDWLQEPLIAAEPPLELVLEEGDPTQWQVRAEYVDGLGDASAPATIDQEIPAIIEVSPAQVTPGEIRHLRIRGSSLYLHAQTAALDLGPDLQVSEVNVRDADTLEALVEVHPLASPGPRAAVIFGTYGEVRVDEALWVVDGALPRITSVSPARILQGATETIEVRANLPFAGPLTVEHPEGLVLRGDPTVEGERAWLEVGVHSDAPLGTYSLILDDGVRRLVADLVVQRRVYTGQRRCASGPLPASSWLWLGLGALLVGSRRRSR